MGVPQSRERTFFVARRQDLGWEPLKLAFNEPPVTLRQALQDTRGDGKPLGPKASRLWENTGRGENFSKAAGGSWFTWNRLAWNAPSPAVVSGSPPSHPDEPRHLSNSETIRVQSFPDDYNFQKRDANYICGMSVPPYMTQRVALEIGRQWFGIEYDP
jgi:DNA (cytosine-5)-methyltransferase 1